MDQMKYNSNLPNKLKLISFASLNSKIKIKNDPIPNLFIELNEIKAISEFKSLTKILYYNIQNVHKILYDSDEIVKIDDTWCKDFAYNFYLNLLITAESEIINYEFSIKYINIFNQLRNIEQNNYFNLIKSKIIIDLINNIKNGDLYDENADGKLVSKIEDENREYIKNNLNILKDINLNLNEDDIIEKNIDELYVDIIIALIKIDKLSDFDYSSNIIKQLDLDNIDLPLMESDNLFERIKKVLDLNNDYIQKYSINNFEDINDMTKVNFYYMILKYILKSSIYIYHIPWLFQTHKKIIEILKIKEYITFTITKQIFIERIEFILRKLCDIDYIYFSRYYNKKEITSTENNSNIKSSMLKKSKCIFDISVESKIPKINKIEFIYEDNKKISYEELQKVLDINSECETKSELNDNFLLYLNWISSIKNIIENQIGLYGFDNYNFKLNLEFINTYNNNITNNIYNIKVIYTVQDHSFFLGTEKTATDDNILVKKLNELKGFESLMVQLNFKNNDKLNSNELLSSISTLVCSKIDKMPNINNVNLNNNNIPKEKKIFFISEEIKLEEIERELKIIEFEKLIYAHAENVKFFLSLKNGYYLSCGNDKLIILYDQDFNVKLIMDNLREHLYYISEKQDDENFIELIACYGKVIYLFKINKNNFEHETANYEIPGMTVLFCSKIKEEEYIICGITSIMKILDLFNIQLPEKKMFKLLSESYKFGLLINENYVALFSSDLIPNGINKLVICDLTKNEEVHSISDFSFNLSENSMSLINLDNKKFLFCACKNYKKNQKNGVLVVDINNLEEENINYKFYETEQYEVYCFCQIFDTNFILIGGFDINRRKGSIRLYKFDDENEDKLIFIKEIKIADEIKGIKEFDMPVNNIVQTKDTGKIVITTINGKIYLFTKPNLDYYNKKHKG